MRGWWRIGAMCAALVALVWRAFHEAVQSRPQQ